jgi:amino acid adenylation domain-containing protein
MLDTVFFRHAEDLPDAIAVEYVDRTDPAARMPTTLSFADMARRADALAQVLTARGVGPGSIVGVAAVPSAELIIAILGVLRAGGAWLPLDPAYPKARLEYMVRDSGISLLVADPASARLVPAAGLGLVDPNQRMNDDDRCEPSAGPLDLAYVIYTSGSTGRPKGVAVSRANLANMVDAQTELFGVRQGDRVLQFAATSFDASVFEIGMAFHAGATLVLARRELIAPGRPLFEFLRDRHINNVTLPPSVLATLPPERLSELRTLVCAGEALPGHLARQWAPGRRMFNAYGPTETTVWATLSEVAPETGKPSIGKAIHGVHTAVMDSDLRPVAPGEPGELAIGGRGVARGYLRRPALTAQRFVPDPAAVESGGRLYLTGDRVVLRPDGELEFLGRLDDQVKIAGYRIEPDEIAHVLAAHPQVQDACVLARNGQLIGYATGDGLQPTELIDHIAREVPRHMVPAVIEVLEHMPLTPSGKIDRAALPAPAMPAEHVPAGSGTEVALAGILAGLLGIEKVSVTESLVRLGTHSLLAAQLTARVRSELGRELPLRKVFELANVRELAGYLDSTQAELLGFPPVERPAVQSGNTFPLSYQQERIWFLESLAPGNLAYNAQATLRLRGPLDRHALQATLTEIVRRHEIMRSAFVTRDGLPRQIVHPASTVALPLIDLSDLPPSQRTARAEEVIRNDVDRSFDLAQPQPVRWTLVKYADDDHELIHVEHHLVHDGWSYALFLRELTELYPPLAAGRPADLPQPPMQYADFVRWQRQWLTGEVLASYVAHWRQGLTGTSGVLDLPTDRLRPPVQSFAGSAIRFDLPEELSRALRTFSRARQVTLFSVMLAAFAVLLARYSGQRDIVIGTGIANRRLTEFERLLGMFVNTLPIRLDVAGEAAFEELVQRTQAVMTDAYEWQDVPLDHVVRELIPEPDLSRNPLFQTMFSFHDSHLPDLAFGALQAEVLERHNGSAKLDLNIVVLPRAEQALGHGTDGTTDAQSGITLIWEYATDLFDEATMRGMIQHYLRLISAALAAPGDRCDELPMQTRRGRARALRRSTGQRSDFPRGSTIDQLFELQVAARPDSEAVIDGRTVVTYAELDRAANRVAESLRHHQAGNVPIGVFLPRGSELIVALLGILKAGAAYVPLNPEYPAQRLDWMLTDTAMPCILTTSQHSRLLPATGAVVIEMDASPVEPPPARLPASPHSGKLAYLLYTSGSTGRPKAVMVEHRAVLRLVFGADYLEFGPGQRFAQMADPSFDAFTFEVWGALLHGGTVCVVPTDTLLSSGGLRSVIREHRLNSMFVTSALFTEIMSSWPDSFAGVDNLIVGGDALNVHLIRRLLSQPVEHRPARLLNGYGPTETTTFAVCHQIEQVAANARSVPIGRPISNTSAYVLDDHLEPVPDKVPGELYLGGPGVARGYAGRPGLTAQRFLPNRFSGDGSRMYRTGDIVRRAGDGTLEFLGRRDNQVKIRGFRVEPSEVEVALTGHPDIDQAAVTVVDGEAGDRRLVAYYVPTGRSRVTPEDVRGYLVQRLPGYMIPATLSELTEIPLNSSGKLDRMALARASLEPAVATGFTAPRTSTEAALARLFGQLLGLDSVSATANFFALGGHSLLAMRLVARASEVWGVDLPLRHFLESPSVAGLARTIDDRSAAPIPGHTSSAAKDERLLERVADMLDEEVEQLLRDITAKEAER